MKKTIMKVFGVTFLVALLFVNFSIGKFGEKDSLKSINLSILDKAYADDTEDPSIGGGASTTACSATGSFNYASIPSNEAKCSRKSADGRRILCGFSNDCTSSNSGEDYCTSHHCTVPQN